MTSSDSANQLLQPDADDKFTSYDIPLCAWLGDKPSDYRETPNDDLPYSIQTTRFITDNSEIKTQNNNLPLPNPPQSKRHTMSSMDTLVYSSNSGHDIGTADREVSEISHGFMFGAQSIPNLTTEKLLSTKTGEDSLYDEYDDLEDEGISEVYGWNSQRHLGVRQSNRSSIKQSPETTRHAISQRIGGIGGLGHHIALGHRLGLLNEDKTLIPNKLKVTPISIVVTEDSPVQIELNWTKPNNSSTFTSLSYNIDATLPNTDNIQIETGESSPLEWIQGIASTRWPTFRIYHTDDKLFIGKQRIMRRRDDVVIKLRVCCHGELLLPQGVRHWTMGPCSKTVDVIFEGYTPFEVQHTNL